MQEFKFDYDSENDDLFIYSDKKSKGAVELGNLVFDFDSDGKIVAIQIMNTTEFLKDLTETEISRDMLKSVKACKVSIKTNQNLILIRIILIAENRQIPIPLSVPSVVETSPSLKY